MGELETFRKERYAERKQRRQEGGSAECAGCPTVRSPGSKETRGRGQQAKAPSPCKASYTTYERWTLYRKLRNEMNTLKKII